MSVLTKLFDSEDYALMIVQITICSLVEADFIPFSRFWLIPVGIMIIRFVISLVLALGSIAIDLTTPEEEEEVKITKRKKKGAMNRC